MHTWAYTYIKPANAKTMYKKQTTAVCRAANIWPRHYKTSFFSIRLPEYIRSSYIIPALDSARIVLRSPSVTGFPLHFPHLSALSLCARTLVVRASVRRCWLPPVRFVSVYTYYIDYRFPATYNERDSRDPLIDKGFLITNSSRPSSRRQKVGCLCSRACIRFLLCMMYTIHYARKTPPFISSLVFTQHIACVLQNLMEIGYNRRSSYIGFLVFLLVR